MDCGREGEVTGSKGSAPGGNGVSCSWGRKLYHSHEMSSARPSRRPVNDVKSQIQQWKLLQASKQADGWSPCQSAIVSNNTCAYSALFHRGSPPITTPNQATEA